jgi:hypothetical protein
VGKKLVLLLVQLGKVPCEYFSSDKKYGVCNTNRFLLALFFQELLLMRCSVAALFGTH